MDNLNKNSILNGISTSSELDNSLLEGCLSNKKSGDFKFRYSRQIFATMIAGIIAIVGTTTYAASDLWKKRMAEMPAEESQLYEDAMIGNTLYSFSRELTESEHARWLSLREEYYNGKFPENTVSSVDKIDDLPSDTLCFVKQTGILYLPEHEMTDEELLQYIDFCEKMNYTFNETVDKNLNAIKDEDVKNNLQKISDNVELTGPLTDEEIKEKCTSIVTDYLGINSNAECYLSHSYNEYLDPETLEPVEPEYERVNADFYISDYINISFLIDTGTPLIVPSDSICYSPDEIKELSIEAVKKYFDYDVPSGSDFKFTYFGMNYMIDDEVIFACNCSVEISNNPYWYFTLNISPKTGEVTTIYHYDDSIYKPRISASSAERNVDSYISTATDYINSHFAVSGSPVNIAYRLNLSDNSNDVYSISLLMKFQDTCFEIELLTNGVIISFNNLAEPESYDESLKFNSLAEPNELYIVYK